MNKDKREHNSPFKDKRIILIYIIVIIALLAGVTYALQSSSLAFNLTTALIGLDEEKYGDLEFDSSNLDMVPILDSEVESRPNNVIKIDFKVGGARTNNASKSIIYDIALVNLDMHCALISNYLKWKLVKDGTELSSGSFSYTFDTIKEGRLVLTNTQEDLPDYSSSENGYHNYSFYIWISDSCQTEDISTCVNNTDAVNEVTEMMNKSFSGKIEVELYTGSKKALVRTPGTEMDYDACRLDSFSTTISYKKTVQEYTVMYPGYYALTAVGAAGGGATAGAGGGGAASGTIYLEKGEKLYIVTGGVGTKTEGGYNGGGSGGTGKETINQGYGGGGATHIATTDRGVLVNYQSNTSDLLLVAGGGGGVSGAGTGSKVGTGVSNDPLSGGNSEADGGYDIHASDTAYFSGNPGTGATTSSLGVGGAAVEAIRDNNGSREDNTTAYSGGGGGGGGGYYGGGGGAGGHVLNVELITTNNSGLNGSFGQGGNAGDGKSEEVAYHATAGGGGGGGSHYFSSKLTDTFYDNSTNVSAGYVVITYIPEGDYVVTFDTGDGTMTNPIKTITPGEEYGALPTPTKEGFYFNGWFTESINGTKITSIDTVDTSGNKTLYAHWITNFESQGFGYTGDVQTFTVPHNGTYKLEAWGAQGGSYNTSGGKGAYVSGEIYLEQNTNLYVYVGGRPSSYNAGYNGGGTGGNGESSSSHVGRGGGGGTDFRLIGGEWNDPSSLASRIMVAAGGAGSGYYWDYNMTGGAAGALTGYKGTIARGSHTLATGATQTAGGLGPNGNTTQRGFFGYSYQGSISYGTGGGGGYYGGGPGGSPKKSEVSAGAGGSSYVSGYTGCVAITSESNITPKSGCTDGTTDVTCSHHYSGYIFSNPQMIDGKSSQPTVDGTSTQTGHASSGYAKISLVS